MEPNLDLTDEEKPTDVVGYMLQRLSFAFPTIAWTKWIGHSVAGRVETNDPLGGEAAIHVCCVAGGYQSTFYGAQPIGASPPAVGPVEAVLSIIAAQTESTNRINAMVRSVLKDRRWMNPALPDFKGWDPINRTPGSLSPGYKTHMRWTSGNHTELTVYWDAPCNRWVADMLGLDVCYMVGPLNDADGACRSALEWATARGATRVEPTIIETLWQQSSRQPCFELITTAPGPHLVAAKIKPIYGAEWEVQVFRHDQSMGHYVVTDTFKEAIRAVKNQLGGLGWGYGGMFAFPEYEPGLWTWNHRDDIGSYVLPARQRGERTLHHFWIDREDTSFWVSSSSGIPFPERYPSVVAAMSDLESRIETSGWLPCPEPIHPNDMLWEMQCNADPE